MKDFVNRLGFPRLIIIIFLILLMSLAIYLEIPVSGLITDILVRFGMNAILVLAMVPGIQSGIGLNFNIPLGIVCGLIGALISVEFQLTGFTGLFASILISVPLAGLTGFFYGKMLNGVKGQEMTVGNYVGYSVVSFMCIFWLLAPFKSPELIWAYGGNGLRVTVSLESSIRHVLDDFLAFNIGNIRIPTGLILFFAILALIIWVYSRSNKGLSMIVTGSNVRFALSNGIDVDRERIKGTVMSTVLAAIGIIVYSQSFGFLQLYNAPLYSAMPAAAAILIGGASIKRATIIHVIIGTILFQSLLVVALPVINEIAEGSMSEVIRIIVSNGIILYALTREGGEMA